MKRIGLLILIVLFLGTIRGFSQRCLSGQWGVELSGGWGDGYPLLKKKDLDYSLGLSFFRYAQNQNKWMIGIEYVEKTFCYKCNTIPLNQFLLSPGYSYNVLSNRIKNIFLNLTGGLLLGYESINWGQKNFCDGAILKNRNCFVGGGTLAIELETYLSNRFLVSLRAREKILFNSIKTFHFQYTVSFKFVIN
ncbi:conjugal transfer protein TraO [Butyricimonas sp.]|uniref:conjugal transfer protein TraO n=1 Tax=Butyricimonas sp. TaxID=1969738 RepID=UPI0025C2B48E|nr:conjugal transfer protein TraO [Butyricimonas sp.]